MFLERMQTLPFVTAVTIGPVLGELHCYGVRILDAVDLEWMAGRESEESYEWLLRDLALQVEAAALRVYRERWAAITVRRV